MSAIFNGAFNNPEFNTAGGGAPPVTPPVVTVTVPAANAARRKKQRDMELLGAVQAYLEMKIETAGAS